jgi:hypothetical protein
MMMLLTELVSQLDFELQICRAYGALNILSNETRRPIRHRSDHRTGFENGARAG